MGHALTRREILKQIAAAGVFAPAILASSGRRSFAALPPLPNISSNDAQLVHPGTDSGFNLRTRLHPQLRARCKTPNGVAAMVDWCRTNNVPFATRSGGHCYEDFSQSTSVVIDTSLMTKVLPSGDTATVDAGATLGKVYGTIAPKGFLLPGGSCPTVGVSGHVLGGGFGFMGRSFGLACDSLEWIELVDPQGQIIQADAQQNPDLFWACRGGGGGSFGIATRFRFKLHQAPPIVTFYVDWYLTPGGAAKVMKAWQAWAPQAPRTITSIMRLGKQTSGKINVHCSGWSVGSKSEVTSELGNLTSVLPAVPHIRNPRTFQQLTTGVNPGSPTYFKCKSDYVLTPMSDQGIATLINGVHNLPHDTIVPICDAYGGAVFDKAPGETAFPHRAGTLYCIQYYSSWGTSSSQTQTRLQHIRDLYDSMRPYVSGACYVNYCDKDLSNNSNWPDAYWGANLPRLKQIKSTFDPNNLFRHGQSVPLS
jgi:FAD/FMN-containing dehydrogenase